VLRAGVAASADDLCEFARANMAHFKVPRGFHFVDALPKTATGKIQKYVLRGGSSAIAAQ
jgi:fatty-acyl-CoA synthase